MRHERAVIGFGAVCLLVFGTLPAAAQVPLSTMESKYVQSFDSLATSGTTNTSLPDGWTLIEGGGGARDNEQYGADNGSSTTGDTYSYGAASASERAFGCLRSGTLVPVIGASFKNQTGFAITSVTVSYTGEEWRLGTAGRTDQLDFQVSFDATSLTTGTWVDVNDLDFVTPVTATTGAKDGNAAALRKTLTLEQSLAAFGGWASGATIWIRWVDSDASGADDGLAVDDFELTPHGVTTPPPTVDFVKDVDAIDPGPIGPTSILEYTALIGPAVTSSEGLTSLVITDTLPAGTKLSGDLILLDTSTESLIFTAAADSDAGQVVGGVLTVNVGDLAIGDLALVTFDVEVLDRDAPGTITNTAHAAYKGMTSSTAYTSDSNAASIDVIACVSTPSGSIPLCDGTIVIETFFDTNGNGALDAGEPGIPGWKFLLDIGDVQTTGADGKATFPNIPAAVTLTVIDEAPTSVSTWHYTLPSELTVGSGETATYLVPVTCTCPDDGDGNLCTVSDVCFAGACSAGVQRDCDDHEVCTTDSCAPKTGCVHDANTLACDDGDTTTKGDVCAAKSCHGTPYTCTPGTCEKTSTPNGTDCTVVYSDSGATCDDHVATTKNDQCNGSGGCAGTPYTCTPGACEATSTPNGTGCTTTPKDSSVLCDDNDLGTKNDHCDGNGACAGTPYTCTPSNLCERSVPDGLGGCTVSPIGEGESCDDHVATTKHDVCTSGTCAGTPYTCPAPALPCVTALTPNGVDCTPTYADAATTCSDGSLTTKNDHCDGAGTCAGTPYACTPSQCQASSTPNGTDCTVAFKDLTAACNDSNVNTKDDHCNGTGTCIGTVYGCEPTQCQESSTANGVDCTVVNKAPTALCNDGLATTKDDHCNGSGACTGTTYTCTPGQCEASSTPNGATCTVTFKDSSASCTDGNLGTKNDHCDGAGACTGTPYTCTPSSACETSVANGTGCTVTPIGEGGACNDGSNTTRNDTCHSGTCAGETYACTPTQCQTSSTPDGASCVVVNKDATATCNDGATTTKDDHCNGQGVCVGTTYTCTASQCQASSTPNGASCTVVNKDATATCNDGATTTKDDHCDGAGLCVGTSYTCTPSQCEATSTPNGATCTPTFKDASATCDDGSASTKDDHCNGAGACAGTAFTCTPTQCQASSTPNGATCTVVNKDATATCDDGSASTKDDHCNGQGACAGTAFTCTPTQCQATSTPNGATCTTTNKDATATCDDGNASTKDDHCDGQGACAGTAYTCTPGPCDATATPNGSGCDRTYKDSTTACNDGDNGTKGDHCDGQGACVGTAYTCTPGPCETSATPNGADCTRILATAGTTCDDGNACTSGDLCSEAGACGGDAVTCGLGEVCHTVGGCAATHCQSCEDDEECGASSKCLGTSDGDRCLLACANDDDCAEGQVCREHETGGLRCFDADGACVAPAENPDVSPEPEPEVGPEPVDEAVVEADPDVVDDASTSTDTGTQAEAKVIRGGGGCATGSVDPTLAVGLAAGAIALALRARRRTV